MLWYCNVLHPCSDKPESSYFQQYPSMAGFIPAFQQTQVALKFWETIPVVDRSFSVAWPPWLFRISE